MLAIFFKLKYVHRKGLKDYIPEPYPWCVFVGDIDVVDMNGEVAFGDPKSATNYLEVVCDNIFEVL